MALGARDKVPGLERVMAAAAALAAFAQFTFWQCSHWMVTSIWFTFTHVDWEWIVAAPTGVLFNLWLYHRRHIGAPIVAHAAANASIWLVVVLGPVDLWIFL